MTKPTINFISVSTNQEKLKQIGRLVSNLFARGKKLMIAVPNQQAADYLDTYLWQSDAESFIPHCIATAQTDEKIVITTLVENLNDASVLINLCTSISPISPTFEAIYDLEDNTTPEKALLSKEKKLQYQRMSSEKFA